MNTEPTPAEIEIAATRRAMAERQAAKLAEAVLVCGAGRKAYFTWTLHDRRGLEPDFLIYGYRDEDGPHPGPNELPDWTYERDTSKPMIHPTTGERGFLFRFELWYGHLDEYNPATAEQLAEARVKRQAKELAKEKASMPLFSDQME